MQNRYYIIFFFILFIFSCTNQQETDYLTPKDNIQTDINVIEAINFAGLCTQQNIIPNKDTSCFSITTRANLDLSFTTIITFNPGCTMEDKIVRSGQIIYNWQPGWQTDSTKRLIISFNDYIRNDIKLSGEINAHYIKSNNSIYPSFAYTEKNMKLIFVDKKEFSWEGTKNVKILSGFDSPLNKDDDIVLINYTKTGINKNGIEFSAKADNLLFDNSCTKNSLAKITSGTIILTKNKLNTIIDFGDGHCDGKYEIRQNNISVTLTN